MQKDKEYVQVIRRPHGEGGHKESEGVCRRMIGGLS